MRLNSITRILVLSLSLFVMSCTASSARTLRQNSANALDDLYRTTPGASVLAQSAVAVLVFPDMVKGGLIVGGQYGTGVLFEGDKAAQYYKSVSGSYGLQAGVQKYSYALFFMDYESLNYLKRSEGWELGVGPTIVVADEGFGKNVSTTTGRKGIYAFIWGQSGLMAGLGIQGTKIFPYEP